MTVYLVYTVTETKAIEIPNKFTPLANNYDNDLFNELDEYTASTEFYKACGDIDGDLCALETEDGDLLMEW